MSEVATAVARSLLQTDSDEFFLLGSAKHLFYFGGIVLLLEWLPLLYRCIRAVGIAALRTLYLLVLCYEIVVNLCFRLGAYCIDLLVLPCTPVWRTEQRALTCASMAAGGAGPFQIGTFAVVARPPHHDEVFVVGHGPGPGEVLARTTTEDGSDWMWAVVLPVAGQMSPSVVVGGNARRPPHGIAAGQINWVCTPPTAEAKWFPDAAESLQVIRDGTLLLGQLQAAGASSYPVNAAGAPGPLEPVVLPVALPLVPAAPTVGVAQGGAAIAGPQGVGAVGLHGGADGAMPAGSSVDLKALEGAVRQLQALSLREPKDKRDRRKDKKASKKKKKKDKKKSKKKKKDSSSSSSSSRSRSNSSSSSSSSSSGSSGKKPLRWKDKGKSRHVRNDDLSHLDGLKWKKKGDLVAFAAKHPGALTARGGGIRQVVQGYDDKDIPTSRGVSSGLGSSVHRFERDPRPEGGSHAGGDPGFGKPQGDRKGDGHTLPTYVGDPGGEDEGRQLGESRSHRAGEHAEVLGQQRDAGPDQCLSRRFRRAMGQPGGGSLCFQGGFGQFYSKVVAGLARALGGAHRSCPLGAQVNRLRNVLGEFRRSQGKGLKHSPGHVFPLPPLSVGGVVVVDEKTQSSEPCTGLVQGANLVIAILNFLHGGHEAVGHRPILLLPIDGYTLGCCVPWRP